MCERAGNGRSGPDGGFGTVAAARRGEPVKEEVDLLVVDAAEVVTAAADLRAAGVPDVAVAWGARSGPREASARPLTGKALDDAGVVPAGAVALRGGRVVAVDTAEALLARYSPRVRLSARGGTVVPGFCDAHTHPVFAATREREADLRARGKSYTEIAAAGGGIVSSVRSVREATRDQLAARLRAHLDTLLRAGTTAIEAKSGYGLSAEHELISLELLAEAHLRHPIDIDATCLAAHQVPPEFRQDRDGYIELVTEEILPEVADLGLARSADVFCDVGAFSVEEARAVLDGARDAGLQLRVHADEIGPVGAAELAGSMGAQTADHLVHISDAGIDALVRGGTAPVLLPGTCLSLRSKKVAPARRMIEAGLPLVVASDFNPGTSLMPSLVAAAGLAVALLGMTAAEALMAVTRNAAATLGLPGPRGLLHPGAVGDLVVLDVPSHLFIGYEFGRDPVAAVVKEGRVVWERK
jgi:imidazolonepropionase